MADPTSTSGEVLAPDALGAAPVVVWQDDVNRRYRAVVKGVLLFLLGRAAGKGYASLWSVHLGYLLEVKSAIDRAAPVDEAIGRLERGIQELAEAVDQAAAQIGRLPTAPPGGFALILLAPAIRADPVLSAEFNALLQEWEDAARAATEHAGEMVDTATRFRTETLDQVDALRLVIKDSKTDKPLDDVLKDRYRQRLDLLELAVTRTVVPAVQKAEQADRHAQACWTAAHNAERFH